MEPSHEFAVDRVLDALRLALHGPLAHDERHLQAHELVDHQPLARCLGSGHRLRFVDLVERPRAVDDIQAVPPLLGERVGELLGTVQRFVHERLEVPRCHTRLLRLRVDGDDLPCLVADQVDDRVRHLAPALVHLDLAEEDRLTSDRELLGPPGLIEEGALQIAGAVEDVDLDQRPTVAGTAALHALHRRQHHGFVTHLQVADRRLLRAVEVPARVVREEIEHVLDPHHIQRLRRLGANAVELRHRKLGQLLEPASHYSTETRYGYSGWPPWCTSVLTSGRCSASHSVMRRVSAAVAPSPSITVTISRSSVTRRSSRPVAASPRSGATATMPSLVKAM